MPASERPAPEMPPAPDRAGKGVPARPHSLVERPRLFELLSAGFAGGITLVSAPAGSGKTVLLRSWIDAVGLRDRTAWVSVERDERDPARFWVSVVDALRAAGVQRAFDDFALAPGVDADAVVERVVSAARSLGEPVVLAIDDLHQLVEPAALAQLEQLLTRRPPQLRVILSTRHDPPIGLHRLRLAGELTEVRAGDLRFHLDETRALLAGAGVSLSDAGALSLLTRTEGWVAGLRLAALSLTGNPDPERFVVEFSGNERTVADYLLAEVLERQPEPMRRLLLRTSILERVNGPLADHLLGTTESDRILLELEEANAFVLSIDRERTWFRYHTLLADLLRLELRRREPGALPSLHRAAAEWYAGHGFPIEAIRHAQAAGDWHLAGDLIGQYGFSIALDGSFATMRSLLAPFPHEAFDNPELAAFLAYGEVIRPSLDTAAAYISVAERHSSEVPEERRESFEAMLAVARLTLARWRGDYASTIEEVRHLREPSDIERVGQIAVGTDLRAVALMSLGVVELWAGAGDDAERHLREAAELAREIGRPYVEQGALAHLALAVGRRSITAGQELAERALAILERYGWLSEPIAALIFATIGTVRGLQCRFDEAQPWLDRAEQALPANAEPAKAILVRYARAIQRLGQGRLADAVPLFADVQRLQALVVDPDPISTSARALRIQSLLRLGDIPGARAALATAVPAEQTIAETRVAAAAICLAERKARETTEALAPVLSGGATAIIEDFAAINALVLDGLARDILGESQAAEDDIERALERAEPEGLILPFLVTPAPALLERHPRPRTAHAALLSSVLDVLSGSSLPAWKSDRAEPAEELTESEIRVLRYLPSNLSAPEIAAEVFLSTSTVKTHMRHIYEKLGAHKRTEAVDRARELGLLAPSARSRR